MSITAVRAYLAQFGLDSKVLEFPVSSATVELAAEAAGSPNSAIELTCDQLEQVAQNCQGWGDFCKGWA